MSIPTPYIVAVVLAAGIGGWMWYGDIVVGGKDEYRPETIVERNEQNQQQLFKVEVATFRQSMREASLQARGVTEASDNIAVRAETMGILVARHVQKGQWVDVGDLICSIKIGARQSAVQQREAQLEKAMIDFEAAQKLSKDGFATTSRVKGDKATVDQARAELKSAQIELEKTRIVAPISGYIQDPFANIGDMLQIGDTCANVIRPQSMTMIAQVSEREIGTIDLGDKAEVNVINGEKVTGEIQYIAPSADPATRTFRVEIALPNPDNKILDGLTAVANIKLNGEAAHKLPASAITLDDTGRLGVRAIDGQNVVQFLPVEIVGDSLDGLWARGLPETVKIITRGQDYVIAGQTVDPVVRTADITQ